MKIVIIGAGATGMGVSSKLARENKDLNIHVFQNHNYISLGACSIPYFIANDFKKKSLLNARKTKDFKNNKQYQSKIHFHLKNNVIDIDTNKNQIIYLNKNNIKKTIRYKYLVIATGAKPNVFAPFNQKNQINNIFTVVSKEDAINIKNMIKKSQNIAIIGGSFIGLEMAETCLKLKKNVSIIEAKESLMANVFDKEFSELIYQELTGKNENSKTNKIQKEHYAKILFKTTIKDLEIKDNMITTLITNNNNKINCDLVLLAAGFLPNTNFLEKNNIKLSSNKAIIINEYGQVLKNDNNVYENIFSGGDCATIINKNNHSNNYIPLATSANKIARIIANNIMFPYKKEIWPGTLGASIIRVKKLELARVGIKDDYWKSENVTSQFITSNDIPNYFRSSKPLYLKLFYDKSTYQLIGSEIAGYNKAVLKINALSTAIWNKMDVRELEYLDLIYAPPFSTVNDIIHIAARKIKSKSGKN